MQPTVLLPRRLAALVAVLLTALLALHGLPAAHAAGDAGTELHQWTLTNPELPNGVIPLGQGRIAESDGRSFLLYAARYSHAPWILVRDEATGEASHVALPAGTTGGTAWARADIAVAGDDLWVLSGGGPVYLRHYRLAGGPIPTDATLAGEHVLGDGESRAGAVTALASGAIAGVWHQYSLSGAQGLRAVHATESGQIRTTELVSMSTLGSTQAIAQHPADGSVWAFSSADASGTIAALRLTESASGLTVESADWRFIDSAKFGSHAPDPEAPNLRAAPDPTTGSIALAYQSAERKVFSTQPWVVGSHLAVARVRADASIAFLSLPTYVERTSAIGLAVRGGETWLTFRPVNPDLSFDTLHTQRHAAGVWHEPVVLGRLGDPRAMVYSGTNSATFGAPMADNLVHLFSTGSPHPADPPDSPDEPPGDEPQTTTKGKKGGGTGGGGGGRKK